MFWLQGGLLAATLIMAVKTGLILGTSWCNRRWLAAVSGIFGIVLYGLVLVFGIHREILVDFLDRYTFTGSLVMAIFLIYLGLQQEPGQGRSFPGLKGEGAVKPGYIQEEKKDLRKFSHWKYVPGFLPCPLCLAALAFSIILVSSMADMPLLELGRKVAIFFSVLVILVAVAARKLIQLIKFNPAAVFNTLLLFIGLLTLVFVLVIPNFVQAMAMPLTPLTVSSPCWVVILLAGMSCLGLLGYFRYQISYIKDRDLQ